MKQAVKEEMARWIQRQPDSWDFFFTVTTRTESTDPHSLLLRVVRALSGLHVLRAFLVSEPFYLRKGYHVHGLVTLHRATSSNPNTGRLLWQRLHERFGRSKVEIPRSMSDVANYCAKYLTKSDLDDWVIIGRWQ